MKATVTVFDFDKTLTDKDTLFGFYKAVAGEEQGFRLRQIVLLASAVLYKLGLIDNNRLKKIGTLLFLKGRKREEIEAAARAFSKEIELNEIYLNHYQHLDSEKWIVSASPEIYLKYLFPGERVAGTTFTYSEGKLKGLNVNMFGIEKKRFLKEKGVTRIYKFYTDSMADKPLMDIAQNVFLVKDGKVKILKSERSIDSE